ncbi:MAG: hypothetical protein FWC40_08955 [Proteobacteria bacterium]|nr:hypothetical protein [Pseudomonadota bacterium]
MAGISLGRLSRGLLFGSLFMFTLPAAAVFAQDTSTFRDEIRRQQIRVDELKREEIPRYNSEMAEISSWIDEALILIGRGNVPQVRMLVLKSGVYIDYVEANLARDRAVAGARDAESRLRALRADHGKLEAMVQQLSAESEILRQQLDTTASQ